MAATSSSHDPLGNRLCAELEGVETPLSDSALRFFFRPLPAATAGDFPTFLFLVELAAARMEALPPWLSRYSVRISCAVSL